MRDRVEDIVALGEPEIRVRVQERVESVDLAGRVGGGGAGGGVVVHIGAVITGSSSGGEGVRAGSFGQDARPVRVTLEQGAFVVRAAPSPAPGHDSPGPGEASATPLARYPSGGAAAGVVISSADGAGLSVNSKAYPGRVWLLPRADVSDRAFDVIELVKLEEYLPGVVAKEMYADWPRAAFEAQAIVARTYALQERARSLSRGESFDVEAGQADQAYDGSTLNNMVRESVKSTRGTVLTHRGKVLRAYYSSTCGGRTAAARDTWPVGKGFEFNLAEPIQSHGRDSFCQSAPLYRWTVKRDRRELALRLGAFGETNKLPIRRLREVSSIQVMQTNSDERPNRFRVVEPGGTSYELSGEELRLACNTSAPGLPGIDRKDRVWSSDFSVSIRGDAVTIDGRGFGHGVGMCQYCARAMAQRGDSWSTMLERFYPGARWQRVY